MYKSIKYLLIIISFFFIFQAQASKTKIKNEAFTIVIDAGHGGKDIGATDNGVNEKDINLKVALQLESIIKKKLKDTKVVMTRDKDTYLTLQERADKANKSEGDIFISIHTNSVDKKNKNRKTVEGSSVYVLGLHKTDNNMQVAMRENSVIELESNYEQKYSGFDPTKDESYIIFEMSQKNNLSQSIKLAENIEKELVNIGRADRGVHQAGFWVLWATSMPSVLVELDFICNPQSAKYISSDKGAKEMAEAIFKAIEIYEKNWRSTREKLVKAGIPADQLDIMQAQISQEESENNLTDIYLTVSQKNQSQKKHVIDNRSVVKDYTIRRKRRNMISRNLSDEKNFETDSPALIALAEGKSSDCLSSKIEENVSEEISDEISKPKENKKNKAQSKKQKKNKNSYNSKVDKLYTVYKIQIYSSKVLLNQDSPCFCGLSPITAYKENDTYKYFYAESSDKKEIETKLSEVKKKIPEAFIVKSTKSKTTS